MGHTELITHTNTRTHTHTHTHTLKIVITQNLYLLDRYKFVDNEYYLFFARKSTEKTFLIPVSFFVPNFV